MLAFSQREKYQEEKETPPEAQPLERNQTEEARERAEQEETIEQRVQNVQQRNQLEQELENEQESTLKGNPIQYEPLQQGMYDLNQNTSAEQFQQYERKKQQEEEELLRRRSIL